MNFANFAAQPIKNYRILRMFKSDMSRVRLQCHTVLPYRAESLAENRNLIRRIFTLASLEHQISSRRLPHRSSMFLWRASSGPGFAENLSSSAAASYSQTCANALIHANAPSSCMVLTVISPSVPKPTATAAKRRFADVRFQSP
jgi:hypothetical protein